MNVRRESREEAYDVVVVGSGMGALSAAALLAKAGKSVLVVERHDRPGGYAHGFKRGKYHFDSAAHATSAAERTEFGHPGVLDQVLTVLGVRDRCTFLPIDPFYTVMFPGYQLTVPTGVAEFVHAHAERFPDESRGLRDLMRLHIRVNTEDKRMPADLTGFDRARLAEEMPLLADYHDLTLGEVMDRHLRDPQLKALFSALWAWLGLPPSKLAFVPWAAMLTSMIHTGAYACQGGLQRIPDAFVAALERDGGELLLRTHVRRILVDDGGVSGVVLENGQRIRAPVVVSNADPLQTFEEMVGSEHLPSDFLHGLRQKEPSLSAVVAYLATDMDLAALGVAQEVLYFKTWDHDEAYRLILAGEPAGVYIVIPTLTDPTLAPEGEHVVSITTLVPYDLVESWRGEKDRFAAMLLQQLAEAIPGIDQHITFIEGASPRTLERYTLNLAGAMYGWEQTPEQTGLNWLTHATPVEGLYLSGHWTQPGGGVITTIVSGVQTAQLILGASDTETFLKTLA